MQIMVGYLPTPEGEAALRRAVEEARLRAARLIVVTSASVHDGTTSEHVYAASYAASKERLDSVSRSLAAAGVEHEIKQVPRGATAGDDLLEVAKSTSPDLIVIGLRRRSRVGKLVLGSNAQDVLLGADCPVLAVKADRADE